MAEIAAGAIAAEQVVMTGVEAAAAVAVAKPTGPLKGTLSQVTVPLEQDTLSSLARSHHTVTVIGDRAYIFGGEEAGGQLCNTDVHAVTLSSGPRDDTTAVHSAQDAYDTAPAQRSHDRYPAFPLKDATTGELLVPRPRTRHAAAARGNYLLVHGGVNASGAAPPDKMAVEDAATIWLWDAGSLKWARIHASVQIGASLAPRWGHALFVDEGQDVLVLHGGRTAAGPSAETWLYDFNTLAWMELPPAPVASPDAANVAFSDGTLFVVSTDPGIEGSSSSLGATVHFLKLGRSADEREKTLRWERVDFPSNPLAPGPKVRDGGALVPVSTGYGRGHLIYMFGATTAEAKAGQEFQPDVWSLQLPSSAFTPSSIKDAIREKLPGVASESLTWSEVEIVPTEMLGHEGKAHPGPIAFFGATPCLGGKGVFMWGGSTADGEKQADGWLLEVS
ncbi:hypothetical protein GGTG_05560 [Gaeumannomyces tritici R3-111a-1]|uniref:Kelch domain-containing protein n=1 Tax=Gaeumannomyces tritici (strain R3-111a-1) TaxID=644352 RepID=J3NW95_GAET3|nr:hypothetical protein GGTG_05560 [Gaeumannomyces tritici R3-111a-1]EJT75627.1 hypothetical protein GGTG_05560 [Gaeumannomyces tritici R3-111a-1]